MIITLEAGRMAGQKGGQRGFSLEPVVPEIGINLKTQSLSCLTLTLWQSKHLRVGARCSFFTEL